MTWSGMPVLMSYMIIIYKDVGTFHRSEIGTHLRGVGEVVLRFGLFFRHP